ncbi:Ig-like domain-containing protein [Candidatus Microgenomates bacterium]|nr:Ig-like domain-containing protein [Candidatus Microgenomates bacterium]
MQQSTHRLRYQEKRVFRRFLYSLVLIIAIVILAIYAGLPLLAKIILAFSSLKKNTVAPAKIEQTYLFPPVLDPTYEATNSANIMISGLGEKDTTVKIFVNGREVAKVLADAEGKFYAKKISLEEGQNEIYAKNIKDKQESSSSSILTIIYQKNPPKIEITNPKDGERISSDNKNITITGETEPGNRIIVNDRLAIVNSDGKFNYSVGLSDGENKFKIVATDAAGNSTTAEFKVTYSP